MSKKEEEADGSVLHNGSILLEDLVASSDGKSNPIRYYSAEELIRATNNFHPSCCIDKWSCSYKGFLDNRLIIVKQMELSLSSRHEAIRDIIISTQMSSHKNVLKLLGCCLEFPVPALVHEYAAKGVLNSDEGYGDNESLPWKTRLCIAKQVANVITYLHTAFPRPIIHRILRPNCIYLDHDFVPKLCDFSLSITIPPKQSHVENLLIGSAGYLDPESIHSSYITEKADVYSFGVILLVLMTGKNVNYYQRAGGLPLVSYVKLHASDGQFQRIVDPKVLEELRGDDEQARLHQLHDFLALALLCTQNKSEARPDMIDVAKELVRIEKSIIPY